MSSLLQAAEAEESWATPLDTKQKMLKYRDLEFLLPTEVNKNWHLRGWRQIFHLFSTVQNILLHFSTHWPRSRGSQIRSCTQNDTGFFSLFFSRSPVGNSRASPPGLAKFYGHFFLHFVRLLKTLHEQCERSAWKV